MVASGLGRWTKPRFRTSHPNGSTNRLVFETVHFLDTADLDGLKPDRYGIDSLRDLVKGAGPSFPTHISDMGWMNPLYANLCAAVGKAGLDSFDDSQKHRIALTMGRLRLLPAAFACGSRLADFMIDQSRESPNWQRDPPAVAASTNS